MPHARNPFFTGREKILEQLQAVLAARGVVALSGLGGVGKTQTAVEYAYRHRDEYIVVLWAKADSRESLVSDFVVLANLLNLPQKDAQDQNITVTVVKRWLEQNTNWLLILDNADDLATAREFLPAARHGHVLLTTRAQTTGSIAQRIEIEEMEPEEGALFLLRRAKIIAQDAQLEAASIVDQEKAKELSQAVDGLPLALDQASAFIEEVPSSLAEYLDLYKREGAKLRAIRGGIAPDHPSVAATFSLAFQKVADRSPAAADLIRVCAFLASDAIPEEVFTAGAVELGKHLRPTASNSLAFMEVLKEAGRFSLIERDPATKVLTIHRLVQEVLKDEMDQAIQRQWAERTVRALNHVFPDVEFSQWPLCERLLLHVQTCAELTKGYNFEFSEAAHLLNQVGFYLADRAQYAQAESLYQRALAILQNVFGPDHPHTATSLNNLAALYDDQGRYSEAEPLYQRALAIREKGLGPEHPDTAIQLGNLAKLYNNQGRYSEAEPLYQRALAIREKGLGPDHPDTATSLNNLAALYNNQGRYSEAEPLYQRTLTVHEKTLGPEHPHTTTSLSNLASLYKNQELYAQAQPLYQRALAIYEKVLGSEHPHTTTSLNNLAALYDDQGRYTEAELLYQRALAVHEKTLGPEHPHTTTSLNNLAGLYYKQGRYTEAEPLYQRALMISTKGLGPEHPDTATSLNNLARLYDLQGRYVEAELLYRGSLAIREKTLGFDHPHVAISLERYATLLRKTNREDEAEKLEARARAIREKQERKM